MARVEKPPAELVCAITQDVMRDPVMLAASQETFERAAAEQYFAQLQAEGKPLLCPTTRTPVPEPVQLLPQRRIKALAEEWLAKHSVMPAVAPSGKDNTQFVKSATKPLYEPAYYPAAVAIPIAMQPPAYDTFTPGLVHAAPPATGFARSQPPAPLLTFTVPALTTTRPPPVPTPSTLPAPLTPAHRTPRSKLLWVWSSVVLAVLMVALGVGVGVGVGLQRNKAAENTQSIGPPQPTSPQPSGSSLPPIHPSQPLSAGPYVLMPDTYNACLAFFAGNGGDINPWWYKWSKGTYLCGWDNYANMASDGQSIWWLDPISADIAGAPDRYIIRSGRPVGPNTCLIVSGRNDYSTLERYYWSNNSPGTDSLDVSSACGFPSMLALVSNKQAVWQIKGIAGTPEKYTIESDAGAVNGMRCLAMQVGNAHPTRLPPSSDGYCGFGSSSALLADRAAVWTIKAIDANDAGACPGQDGVNWGQSSSEFATVLASSADDCANKCAATASCYGWVFHKSNGQCSMKSQDKQGNGFFSDGNVASGAGCFNSSQPQANTQPRLSSPPAFSPPPALINPPLALSPPAPIHPQPLISPFSSAPYIIMSDTAPTDCLIFSGNGGDTNPTLYNWAKSSYYCGWDNYANLTSNGQATWWLNPISTDIAGAPDRYIIRAGKPSSPNSCLIISGHGDFDSPERYYWGTNPGADPIEQSSACGHPSMTSLVGNKQAVWQIKGIAGTTNKYTIEIDTGVVSGMRCLAMLSGSGSPPTRLSPSSDGFCGFGSSDGLLADKRAVWTIIAPQHDTGVCPGQDNTDWGKTTSQFATVDSSSPDDCSSKCAATAPCFGWVYQKANGFCHFKSQDMQGNGFFNMSDVNLVAGAGCR